VPKAEKKLIKPMAMKTKPMATRTGPAMRRTVLTPLWRGDSSWFMRLGLSVCSVPTIANLHRKSNYIPVIGLDDE
jgi:hypothetical protein